MKNPSISSDQAGSSVWAEAFPGIDKVLAEALAAANERHSALASPLETAADSLKQRLEGIQELIGGLAACAERSGQTVAEVDHLLKRGEKNLRGQLSAIDDMRRRLAEWAGRAIG